MLSRLKEHFRRNWLRMLIGVLILGVFAAHAAGKFHSGFIDRLEAIAYDARLLFTMPGTVDKKIVIVDIDEKSLAREGRWPWSRAVMAHLVDQLFDRYHVALVAFDVVFAEPEETSGLKVLDELAHSPVGEDPAFRKRAQALRSTLDHDAQFAHSIAGRPVILGFFLSSRNAEGHAPAAGKLPPPAFDAGDFLGRNIPFIQADGYSANLAPLQDAALGAGHLMTLPDSDGVVRRVPMLYEYKKHVYEALSLVVAKTVLGVDRVVPGYPPGSVPGSGYSRMEWLQVGDHRIPVDGSVRALIPYRGRPGSFPYVSATDVLHGHADPSVLKGRIVLVGTSAEGLLDLRATPVAPNYPGVEAHANLIAGILENRIMEHPAYTVGAEFVLLLFSGLVMVVILPLLSPLWAAAVTVGLLAVIVGINLWIWQAANFVFPLANGLLCVLTLFLFNMSWGFFVESRGKRQLAGRFGQYVPPELVDEMSDDPDAFTMETVSRDLTVLFSDVRSFTTISEGLAPKDLSDLMNAYLSPMTRIIYDYRGTIDKYMGDAIMAFWGAPLDDPQHARHALECAMQMSRRLRELREEFGRRGWPPLRIGIGINTGEMRVGNMGSEYRVAYTVMGDAVNLGSRLEGLTKQYGVEIIVSEFTRAAVSDFAYRELDRVRVKGKDEPVRIYEPLGPADAVERALRDELKIYAQALKLYRAQDWDMAELQFLNLQRMVPDCKLYTLYPERIAHFRREPPGPDWDGAFTFETK